MANNPWMKALFVILLIVLLLVSFVVLTKLTQRTYVTATFVENRSGEEDWAYTGENWLDNALAPKRAEAAIISSKAEAQELPE